MSATLTFSWSKPTSLASCTDCSFEYKYALEATSLDGLTPIPVSFGTLSVTIPGLVNGESYHYAVRTICGPVQSKWSYGTTVVCDTTPVDTPTPTPTDAPTATPTPTPTMTPTATPTPTPTATDVPTPTPEPTPGPTTDCGFDVDVNILTPTPTPTATLEPTPTPTAGPVYWQYDVTRYGIPGANGGYFTYIDTSGNTQTVMQDTYGYVGRYCMLEGSYQNNQYSLYSFSQYASCS